MPLPIMSARVSLSPLPPQLMVNANRKGLYDVLEGGGSPFYNTFAETGRLNLTVFESTGIGSCWTNVTNGVETVDCDGSRGQLLRKETDFSFFANEMSTMPDSEYLTCGPVTHEALGVFTSMPQTEAQRSFTSITDIFTETPPIIYGLTIFVYMVSCLILNWSVKAGTFKRRLGLMAILSMVFLKPYQNYQTTRHRLAYLSCLLMAFYFFILFTSNTKSEMVTTEPAKYCETLEDIIRYNRTPILVKGLPSYIKFKVSKDPIKQKLLEMSERRGTTIDMKSTGSMPQIAQMEADPKIRGVAIHHSRYGGMACAALMCIQSEFNATLMRRMKFSRPFSQHLQVAPFRRHIWEEDPKLARRLHDLWTWYLEGGLFIHHHGHAGMASDIKNSGIADYLQLILCLKHLDEKNDDVPDIPPLPMKSFEEFIVVVVGMLTGWTLVLGQEVMRKRWEVRRNLIKSRWKMHLQQQKIVKQFVVVNR